MNENTTIHAEDVLPVRSRVSWGAVFAGAFLALAAYLVLTLFGAAVGLSVGDSVRPESLSAGGVVWAILATGVALFVGGCASTRFAVGENKTEAAAHGVLVWGVVFAMLLALMVTGVRAGFNAMVGVANTGQNVAREATAEDWEAAARRAGVPQDSIAEWRRKAGDAAAEAGRAAHNPESRRAAAETASLVTWWTLLGTLLSMAAAVGGALVGSGPTLRLIGLPMSVTRHERREPVGRL